jgi:hypothetical protein
VAHHDDQIAVKVWAKDVDVDGEPTLAFEPGDVQFVSFINEGTYGIPPLLTGSTGVTKAETDDIVLYVNPGEILAMTIEKVT